MKLFSLEFMYIFIKARLFHNQIWFVRLYVTDSPFVRFTTKKGEVTFKGPTLMNIRILKNVYLNRPTGRLAKLINYGL